MEVILPLSNGGSKALMNADMMVLRVEHDVAGNRRSGFSASGKGFSLRTFSERASRLVDGLIKVSEEAMEGKKWAARIESSERAVMTNLDESRPDARYSRWRASVFEEVNYAIEGNRLRPAIDKTFTFKEASLRYAEFFTFSRLISFHVNLIVR
jgi:hypothetical protein